MGLGFGLKGFKTRLLHSDTPLVKHPCVMGSTQRHRISCKFFVAGHFRRRPCHGARAEGGRVKLSVLPVRLWPKTA